MGRGVRVPGDDPTFPVGQSQEASEDISVPGSHSVETGGVSPGHRWGQSIPSPLG